jgi:hypothetical protein
MESYLRVASTTRRMNRTRRVYILAASRDHLARSATRARGDFSSIDASVRRTTDRASDGCHLSAAGRFGIDEPVFHATLDADDFVAHEAVTAEVVTGELTNTEFRIKTEFRITGFATANFIAAKSITTESVPTVVIRGSITTRRRCGGTDAQPRCLAARRSWWRAEPRSTADHRTRNDAERPSGNTVVPRHDVNRNRFRLHAHGASVKCRQDGTSLPYDSSMPRARSAKTRGMERSARRRGSDA